MQATLDRLGLLLATCGGIGFLRPAPGTWGSLLGLPLAWAISHIPGWPGQTALLVVLTLAGIPICSRGATVLGQKDPSSVVFDEWITIPWVFWGLGPAIWSRPEIWLVGLVLHRLFDISKLPPGRQLEQLPGGLGIMADDLAAAAYAAIVLRCWIAWNPWHA